MEAKIKEKLLTIMVDKFNFEELEDWNAIKDIPLTTEKFNFDGILLYQLFMCIEEKFQVYFDLEDIRKGEFNTLSKIETALDGKLAT